MFSSRLKPYVPPRRRIVLSSHPSLKGFNDFLAFRNFITPKIIQIVFWLGTAYFAVAGLTMMIMGLTGNGLVLMLIGLLMLSMGPIIVRVFCELVMLIFKIGDALTPTADSTPANDVNNALPAARAA